MDEARPLERLRAIEAPFAGATTDGERVAATEAAAVHEDVSDAVETAPAAELGTGAHEKE